MFIACLSLTGSSSVEAACFGCNTCRSYGAKYFHDRMGYKHLAPTELALSYVELTLFYGPGLLDSELWTFVRREGGLKTRKPARAYHSRGLSLKSSRRLPTLPHTFACSTIGSKRLNFRVRDGNGCDPLDRTTGKLVKEQRRSPYKTVYEICERAAPVKEGLENRIVTFKAEASLLLTCAANLYIVA
jgi:hypothetical protein